MTKGDWLHDAKAHADDLRELLRVYHPINLAVRPYAGASMTITAPATEAACEYVRRDIVKNSEGDPVTDFDEALRNGNIDRVMRLLSDAWFGVPESTACWRIPGFKAAVDLMDDPPEEA